MLTVSWYRWSNNLLQISKNGQISEILFPDFTVPPSEYHAPVLSKGNRYVAVWYEKTIYVHDAQNDQIFVAPVKFKAPAFDLVFDSSDRLYYCEGNRIGYWDLANQKIEPLYNMARAVHGPESLGVSPSGRYISFCKYRSAGYYLFIYDTVTQTCKDQKFSLYHYIWIDETHIAWTLSGGLKVLDVETGKSKTLLKDWSAVYKKAAKKDADLLEAFSTTENVYTDLDLLGFKDGKLYFSLYISPFSRRAPRNLSHLGIWSIDTSGSCPAFCYTMPDGFYKAIHKGFTENGSIHWGEEEALNIFDGKSIRRLIGPYHASIYYQKINR